MTCLPKKLRYHIINKTLSVLPTDFLRQHNIPSIWAQSIPFLSNPFSDSFRPPLLLYCTDHHFKKPFWSCSDHHCSYAAPTTISKKPFWRCFRKVRSNATTAPILNLAPMLLRPPIQFQLSNFHFNFQAILWFSFSIWWF